MTGREAQGHIRQFLFWRLATFVVSKEVSAKKENGGGTADEVLNPLSRNKKKMSGLGETLAKNQRS